MTGLTYGSLMVRWNETSTVERFTITTSQIPDSVELTGYISIQPGFMESIIFSGIYLLLADYR